MENLKNDFEYLKQFYKRSFCKNDSNVCENCESLEKNIHYLVKTEDKLSKGKSNFETVLAYQSCVFGKFGLGCNPHTKKSGDFELLKNTQYSLATSQFAKSLYEIVLHTITVFK